MPAGKRRWGWLVAAALLLVLAAALMFTDDPAIAPEPAEVKLPKRMQPEERERNKQRRTLISMPVLSDAGIPVAAAPPPRDPLLAMMPAEVNKAVVVAEFNAIVHSDLGPPMLECFGTGKMGRGLDVLRDAGIELTRNVDRVALIDDVMVVSGSFKSVNWNQFDSKMVTTGYGPRGAIYQGTKKDDVFATWGGQLVILGDDEASLKTMLDRLEAPAAGPRVLNDTHAYGEVYGVLAPSMLTKLTEDASFSAKLQEAVKAVTVHADISHDVGLVAELEGPDARLDELRRAVGAGLAAARIEAKSKGKERMVQLLDQASVAAASQGRFRMQAGLPYELMKDMFTTCVENAHAEERQRLATDAGSPSPE